VRGPTSERREGKGERGVTRGRKEGRKEGKRRLQGA